jgi:hypothetical protein
MIMTDSTDRVCDVGNPLLAPQAFRLDLGMATDDDGTVRGVVTTRTASTSLTVYPTPDQLDEQSKLLAQLAAKIRESGTRLVAPNPQVIQQLQTRLGRTR